MYTINSYIKLYYAADAEVVGSLKKIINDVHKHEDFLQWI